MRKVLGSAIIGIFIISLGLAGCGYLKEEKFNQQFGEFKKENASEHEALKTSVSDLDTKVDEQKSSLEESIAEAKNDAIAASEQGDADTIDSAKNFAKERDNELRAEVEDFIQKAKDDVKKFSKSGDKNLKAEINKLNKNIQSDLSKLDNKLDEGAEILEETRKLAQKAMKEKIVVVYFASGRASLTEDAKGKLDTAVSKIKSKGSGWVVKVVGHADARPVLSGRYRSNWDLSYARAVSVKDYLVEKGVTNKIKVTARGHSEPVVAPEPQKGQKENRRVEVVICSE